MSRFVAEVHLKGNLKARALVDSGRESRRKKNGTLSTTTLVYVQAEALVDTLVKMKADQGGNEITL